MLFNNVLCSQRNELQVNHTAIEHGAELLDDECPETDYGEESVSYLLAFS